MRDTNKSEADRLQRLEDLRDIERTLHEYCHTIDAGDETGWLDCFTPDGRFSAHGQNPEKAGFDVSGPALVDFIARHTRRPQVFHQHMVLNPLIDIDGDHARCASRFLVLMRYEGSIKARAFGRYTDRLVREDDGRWRFEWRDATIDGADSSLPGIAYGREMNDE